MNEFLDAVREEFAILFGLLIGAVAHLGNRVASTDPIRWREVIGFAMQLGLIGLLSMVATAQAGITDNDMRALVTAILAVSANEVVQWLKRSGWLRYMPYVPPEKDDPDAKG